MLATRNMKYFPKNNNMQSGYTIIEMMIAISLFLVVVMTGMTALLNANLVQQKSQNMRSILDNLSFVVEDMSRNIRTGSAYHCAYGNDDVEATGEFPLNAETGQVCWGIAFESALGDPGTID